MGLYAFILAIACIAGYGIYELYMYVQRKNTMEELAGPGKDNRNLNRILSIVHNQASIGKEKAITRNKVSKVLLMEQMNLRPKELKDYLSLLSRKNLIKETIDYVTITPFGVQFHSVFANDKLNLGSS